VNTAHGSSGLLRGFRLFLTIEGLSPSTIDSYTRDASRFAVRMGENLTSVKPVDVNAYVAEFEATRCQSTLRVTGFKPCYTAARTVNLAMD